MVLGDNFFNDAAEHRANSENGLDCWVLVRTRFELDDRVVIYFCLLGELFAGQFMLRAMLLDIAGNLPWVILRLLDCGHNMERVNIILEEF